MKNLIFALVALSAFHSYAETPAEKLTIKEIKEHVKTVNPDSTCLDEYLKRRKELIIKLSVTPVVAVAGTMGTIYSGAMVAGNIAMAANVPGFGALGYAVAGGMAGAVGGAGVSVADATITSVTLSNLILITKAVAEQQLNKEGLFTEKLYRKYLKKSSVDLSKEDFLAKLLEADARGTLCDGSMVKQPKIRIGSKLKFKVAKFKDLVKSIDR